MKRVMPSQRSWWLIVVLTLTTATLADAAVSVLNDRDHLAWGDFNGDGRRDVLMLHYHGFSFLGSQAADGSYQWQDNLPFVRSQIIDSLAVGRFVDRDRLIEAVLLGEPSDCVVLRELRRSYHDPAPEPPSLASSPDLFYPRLLTTLRGAPGDTDRICLVNQLFGWEAWDITVLQPKGTLLETQSVWTVRMPPQALLPVRLKANEPEALLVFARMSPETNQSFCALLDVRTAPISVLAVAVNLPPADSVTAGRFERGGPLDVIVLKHAADTAVRLPLRETNAAFAFGAPQQVRLSEPMKYAAAIGAVPQDLFTIPTNGQRAMIHAFTNGQPVLRQALAQHASTAKFRGVLSDGDDALVVFTRPRYIHYYVTHTGITDFRSLRRRDHSWHAETAQSIPVPGRFDYSGVSELRQVILQQQGWQVTTNLQSYTNVIPGTEIAYAMMAIPAGEFVQGSAPSEKGRRADEGPQHRVRLDAFWMGRCEVTQREFDRIWYGDYFRNITATNKSVNDRFADAMTFPTVPYVGSPWRGPSYPVIMISQHAAALYCHWLSAKTGHYYRLPTEAEWEYACRAGTTTAHYFGDDPARLREHGWFRENSGDNLQRVGLLKPNPWGLHDMYGNACEWCLDQYDPAAYAARVPLTVNPLIKPRRVFPQVLRGGYWDEDAAQLRSAARAASSEEWIAQDPQLPKSADFLTDHFGAGFRIVRPSKVPSAREMYEAWNTPSTWGEA